MHRHSLSRDGSRDMTRNAVRTGVETIARAITEEIHNEEAGGGGFTTMDRFTGLIGRSPAMRALFEQIARVAPTSAAVLLVGESGTGKEVVARALHDLGPHPAAPFVAVNCGGIPDTLIEAELFGYERGSFTGAHKAHVGHFERAGEGTLFLDEITEMPLDLQVKLLRVLESRRFHRVGGTEELKVRCRTLAATHRDPQQAIAEGRLRADLLYRLAGFPIALPALREREGDAALLALHFLADLNAEGGTRKRLSAEALRWITQHSWPGNVRALRNALHRAFILADDELDVRAATLDAGGVSHGRATGALAVPPERPGDEDRETLRVPVGTSIADAERWLLMATLRHCAGNKTRAAAMLGLSLKTLYNRLHAYQAEDQRNGIASDEAGRIKPVLASGRR